MSKNQKNMFSKELYDYKKSNGMPPDYNLPWDTLVMLSEEVRQLYK